MSKDTTELNRAISVAYDSMRSRLEGKFDRLVSNYGVNGVEIVADAFAYAAQYIIDKGEAFGAKDLEKLIVSKASLLVKDVYRSAARAHGRKSVKTMLSLDTIAEGMDESPVSIIDRVSYSRYVSTHHELDRNLMARAVRMVVEQSLERRNVCPRNREIVRKVLFEDVKGKAVEAEYHVRRNAVDQMVSRVRKDIAQIGICEVMKWYNRLESEIMTAA